MLSIIQADLHNLLHQSAIVELLDLYSRHPMGDGQPLPDDVKSRLIPGLQALPTTLVFLAWEKLEPAPTEAKAVGLATCYVGFSTFKARPLINIHDLAVLQEFQGRGIGGQLIDCVVAHARQLGCSAVTLEVRRDNPARKLYEKKGFTQLRTPLASDAMLFGKLQLEPEADSDTGTEAHDAARQ